MSLISFSSIGSAATSHAEGTVDYEYIEAHLRSQYADAIAQHQEQQLERAQVTLTAILRHPIFQVLADSLWGDGGDKENNHSVSAGGDKQSSSLRQSKSKRKTQSSPTSKVGIAFKPSLLKLYFLTLVNLGQVCVDMGEASTALLHYVTASAMEVS